MVKMKNYCPEVRKFKQIISSDGGIQRQVCPQGQCIPALSHQTQPHSQWKLEFQQRRHTGARWGPALWCWRLDWTRAGTCAEGPGEHVSPWNQIKIRDCALLRTSHTLT